MKIMTILGTRPEIIRLSRIIPKLDKLCDHVLVHTGQNYDANLNDLFFSQLNLRGPDHYFGARGSLGEQVAKILVESERVMAAEKPDRLLVLGDTNSALSVIMAKRLAIPVFHMEAGNRCYDDRVPEEVNRRIIDHSSDILMPYTERSRQNLLREGIAGERIYVTGNPIWEVIQHYDPLIRQSSILADLKLQQQGYMLVTVHRAENVDIEERLKSIAATMEEIQKTYGLPIIVSTHPHTQARLKGFGIAVNNDGIRFLPPFGFFDFITLERNAFCVLSDSGTVQEECCIFRVPNVTVRDVTERPETIECGSNILAGADPETILRSVRTVVDRKPDWAAPPEYLAPKVSDTVVKILAGYLHKPKQGRHA
ncbi:MAG: UDP-N-acetylglucosamine 2-epimerase (non-hydrolyzing) [Deltaproteobacteria bacterium]|nr:UDP-N-acetylglucosamine 2-epimerase (non-hydrolyzing) [Deltaproteobacteria bacterium]